MARAAAVGGRVSGFWSRYAVEHVCLVGFIRRWLDVHRSDIDVTGLLEFVDLWTQHCATVAARCRGV